MTRLCRIRPGSGFNKKKVMTMVMRKLKKYSPTRFMAKDSHYDKAAADYAVILLRTNGSLMNSSGAIRNAFVQSFSILAMLVSLRPTPFK